MAFSAWVSKFCYDACVGLHCIHDAAKVITICMCLLILIMDGSCSYVQLFDKIRSENPDVLNKVVPMQGDITEKGMHSWKKSRDFELFIAYL